jgi:hypothetical protein
VATARGEGSKWPVVVVDHGTGLCRRFMRLLGV